MSGGDQGEHRGNRRPSVRLPFVHNASIVIHQVPAEAAEGAELLERDRFRREHDPLQHTVRRSAELTHKTCTETLRRTGACVCVCALCHRKISSARGNYLTIS